MPTTAIAVPQHQLRISTTAFVAVILLLGVLVVAAATAYYGHLDRVAGKSLLSPRTQAEQAAVDAANDRSAIEAVRVAAVEAGNLAWAKKHAQLEVVEGLGAMHYTAPKGLRIVLVRAIDADVPQGAKVGVDGRVVSTAVTLTTPGQILFSKGGVESVAITASDGSIPCKGVTRAEVWLK